MDFRRPGIAANDILTELARNKEEAAREAVALGKAMGEHRTA